MEIPQGPRNRVVHLDNSILFPLLGLDDDPDLERSYRGQLLGKNTPQLRISSITLGELNLKLIDEYQEQEEFLARSKFRNWIDDGILELWGLGNIHHWTLRTAGNLRDKDPLIGQTDALIIAAALADTDADGLYMDDKIVTWASLTDFLDDKATWVRPLQE